MWRDVERGQAVCLDRREQTVGAPVDAIGSARAGLRGSHDTRSLGIRDVDLGHSTPERLRDAARAESLAPVLPHADK
jgi:hypothetical protein